MEIEDFLNKVNSRLIIIVQGTGKGLGPLDNKSIVLFFLRVFFVKIYSYMRTHILSVRHISIFGRTNTHAHINKVLCK